MGFLQRLGVFIQKLQDALFQFSTRRRQRVAILDAKTERKNIPHQSIRQPAGFFAGPALEENPGRLYLICPTLELI